jgi:hypothetical protein
MEGDLDRFERSDQTATYMSRAVLAFCVAAIVLRVVRYLLGFPLWCDESMLAVNLLDRELACLAQPLLYRQVCPLGFLFTEWCSVRFLGFSELTLRLFPLICALGSVPLFFNLARKVLGASAPATAIAVAVFTVAEPLIRYAAEVKPYSADLLASLVLLNLAIVPVRTAFPPHRFLALAAAVPAAIVLSLPAVFVISGIALVGLWRVVRERSLAGCVAYGTFIAASGLSLGAMALLGQYQSDPESRSYFLAFWDKAFPPSWLDPVRLLAWIYRTHTGPLFEWVHGAGPGLSWLTAIVILTMIIGAVTLARRDFWTLLLLAVPFALTVLAASLRLYPYGKSVRVVQFLAPGTLILVDAGLARIRTAIRSRRCGFAMTAILLLTTGFQGLWRQAGDLVHPYRTPWDRTARELARWFWQDFAAGGELVCVRTDLGIPFHSSQWEYDGTDQYLCYQRIYSQRHREARPPAWDSISAEHPLLCVMNSQQPDQVPGFRAWIEQHRESYRLRGVRTFSARSGVKREPSVSYLVCEFVPTERPDSRHNSQSRTPLSRQDHQANQAQQTASRAREVH